MESPLSDEVLARIEKKKQAALSLKRQKQLEMAKKELSDSKEDDKSDPLITCCDNTLERKCGREVDKEFFEAYGERICTDCIRQRKRRNTENEASDDNDDEKMGDFDQLTKQEVSSHYLLTDSMIRMMQYMEKSNPRNPHWSGMKLYLRKHAKQLAIERWGSLEDLEKEKNKRSNKKMAKQTESVNCFLAASSGVSLSNPERNYSKAKSKRRKLNMSAIISTMKGTTNS